MDQIASSKDFGFQPGKSELDVGPSAALPENISRAIAAPWSDGSRETLSFSSEIDL
jgi:hypothetical protein